MSVRKRPVITVVEARPMNEVGFRDARATTPISPEVPKVVPPVPRSHPVARSFPPTNNNNPAMEVNPMSATHPKPVPAERKPIDPIDGLDLIDQKKVSNPAPPKPRRTNPVRPVTMYVDKQNNIIADEHKLISDKPLPSKRSSVHGDEMLNNNGSHSAPIGANTNDMWKRSDCTLEESSTRPKPAAAPRKPTIIRASTCESKSGGGALPPPVAPKSAEVKLQAAELIHMTEDEDGSSGTNSFPKPTTKPRPVAKPKLESKSEVEEAESKPDQHSGVRKRPTVIRPLPEKSSVLPGVVAPQNTVSTWKDSVQIPARAKATPTIIRPGLDSHESSENHTKIPTEQNKIVCDRSEPVSKPSEKASPAETVVNEPSKKRPVIIRPNAEARCKDHLIESSVAISKDRSAVHFSASEVRVQPEAQDTRADVSEKQNAENWKRVEMEESRSKAPARPSVPPVQDPFKKPLSRPPPPRSDKLAAQGSSDIPYNIPQRSAEVQPRQGPPPRPTTGPSKINKAARPSKNDEFSSGLGPSLPGRPTLGHPLFHYMVSGPHAIALFEYTSTQPDELAFKAGDVIILEKWINSEWLYGKTAHARGMFPATFVDIIQPPPHDQMDSVAASTLVPKVELSSAAPPSGSGPRCLARFDYNGEDSSDLAFAEGDVIKILERIGDEWMKGELDQRQGMFPISFVEIIEDLPPSENTFFPPSSHSDASPPVNDLIVQLSDGHHALNDEKAHCIALYDFPAQNPDDLGFCAGDKILLLDRINEDWLKGEIHNKTGIFPASFVRIVHDLVGQDLLPDPQILPVDHTPSVESSMISMNHPAAGEIGLETSSKAAKTAVAVYDFPGETEDDLAFHVGDIVEIIGAVNDDWMEGRMNGKSGIFPSAFVKLSE